MGFTVKRLINYGRSLLDSSDEVLPFVFLWESNHLFICDKPFEKKKKPSL